MFSGLVFFLIVVCSEPQFLVVQTEEESKTYPVLEYTKTHYGFQYDVEPDLYLEMALAKAREERKVTKIVSYGECDEA